MSISRVYKFKAFISYRHQDVNVAVALQNFLEKFRLPVKLCREYPDRPKRLGNVFRDFTDLPPKELKKAIEDALATSEYLIVLCSERTNQPNEDGKRWVNEEVEKFLALDEQNKHKIIPVLLPRDDESITKAYMPPSVVALDILATDMARKGELGAYFDVVAALLNLDPVDLRNRAEEEEARRLRNKRIAQGAAAVVLAGASFFAWDYYVPKHRYYAHYEECNNAPVGIGRYSERETKSLGEYYFFEECQYKVRRVEYRNHAGSTAVPLPYAWKGEKTAVALYEYDEQGEATRCTHLDAHGNLVVIRLFTHENTVEYKRELLKRGGVTNARSSLIGQLHTFTLEQTVMGDTGHKNDVAAHYVTRKDGFITQELYRNADGDARPNEDGVWGCRYERDTLGRILRMQFTDAEGQPMEGRKGLGGYVFEYGAGPLPERVRYIDARGKAVAMDGVAEARYVWQNGNMVEESFYDVEGQPAMEAMAGYARMKRILLPSGAVQMDMSYGVDGKPCISSTGSSCTKYAYDERGNICSLMHLDAEGKPVLDAGGVAEMRMQYDGQNRVISYEHLDTQGKLCVSEQGFASTRLEYDASGNVSRQDFFGADGSPCLSDLGHASILVRHNDAGLAEEMKSLGVDGSLIVNKLGFAMSRIEYEPTGEACGEFYYGADETPCLNVHGMASVRISRGKFGKETWAEWRYYGKEKEQVLAKDGTAGMRVRYNELGYLYRREFLGLKGEKIAPPNREAAVHYEYDALGNCTQENLEDASGTVFLKNYLRPDGTAWKQECPASEQKPGCVIEFDTQGRVLKLRFLDKNGMPCAGPDGFAESVSIHDSGDNVVQTSYYDAEGNLKSRISQKKDGSEECCIYGDNGKLTNVSKVDRETGCQTSIIYTPDSAAGSLKETDEQGRILRYMRVDEAGKPVPGENGVSGFIREYDNQGNVALQLFCGADGRPVLTRRGYAGVRKEYDQSGRVVLEVYVDAARNPVMLPEDYSGIRREFDERGNETLKVFLNQEGGPHLRNGENAGERMEYDAQNRMTRMVSLAEDLTPRAGEDGIAQIVYEYSDGGMVWSFRDVSGALVNCPEGFAFQDIRVNTQNQPEEISYRDAAGTPVSWEDGTFRKVYVYDESGMNRQCTEYYDCAGNLLRSE